MCSSDLASVFADGPLVLPIDFSERIATQRIFVIVVDLICCWRFRFAVPFAIAIPVVILAVATMLAVGTIAIDCVAFI